MQRVTSSDPKSNAPAASSQQRRRSRRVPAQNPVEVLLPRSGMGIALNASDGGIRVAVDCALIPGEECQLLVRREQGPTVLTTKVVWSRPVADGWVAGLAMAELQ